MTHNNSLTTREKIFVGIAFLYILFNTVPLFPAFLPISVQLVSIVTVIACGIICRRSLICRPMLWFYGFLLVMIIYSLFGSYFHINGLSNDTMAASSRIVIEAAWIMPSIMLAYILSLKKNFKFIKIIGWGSVILLILSFIYILPVISISANMLRELTSSDAVDIPPGLPDYTLMHSYPLMLPGLCLAFRISSEYKRLMFAMIISLFYYVILKTAVTTSIGISSAFILFSIVVSKKSMNKTILILCFCAIFFIIAYYSGLVLYFIECIMPYFDGTAVSDKLNDIHNSITAGQVSGGSLEVRGELHDLSKQSFYTNPIFGSDKVGRHSHILDILGSMGLFGFVPFIMMIISVIKLYLPKVRDKFDRVFLYSCFAIAIVYLYSKGIFGATGWLFTFVLAPCLVISVVNSSLYKSKQHNHSAKKNQ